MSAEVKKNKHDIILLHKKIVEITGWTESDAWSWIGTPCEELGLSSPAELILNNEMDKLTSFILGIKMALTYNKQKGDING